MKDYQQQTIQTYDDHAAAFQKTRARFAFTERIKTFLSALPGERVLEVGCGPGRDAHIMTQLGARVTGVDLSQGLLEKAKQAEPLATFLQMDATELAFDDESFDGVWASAVYLHLSPDDFAIALSEAFRVLASGGVIRFTLKKGEGKKVEQDPRLDHAERLFFFYSKDDAVAAAEKAGFSIIDVKESTSLRMDAPIEWIDVMARKHV